VPFHFRPRLSGESKLDGHVAWDYGMLLLDKLVGRWIPVRFISFGLIGSATKRAKFDPSVELR
jgi:dolichol-phosphate mannosyltransferase